MKNFVLHDMHFDLLFVKDNKKLIKIRHELIALSIKKKKKYIYIYIYMYVCVCNFFHLKNFQSLLLPNFLSTSNKFNSFISCWICRV